MFDKLDDILVRLEVSEINEGAERAPAYCGSL